MVGWVRMQLGKTPRLLASCCLLDIVLSTCPTLSAHCQHAVCLQEGSDLTPERLKWDSQLSLSPEPDGHWYPVVRCGRVIEERGSLCPTLLPLLHLFPNNTVWDTPLGCAWTAAEARGAGLALRLLGACSQNTTPASLSEKLVPRLHSEWEGGPSHLAMPQNHLRYFQKSGSSGFHTSVEM